MKKSVMFENMLCSMLFDNDKAVPCGKQFGYVTDSEWSAWFPYVDRIVDGEPKEKNVDNLSVWREGRGSFVDMFDHNQNVFYDVKMKTRKPKFFGMKQELWAGSPALEKRENFIDQSDSEVVQEFISNQNEKQIVRSLKGLDSKPYLVMFSWQELSSDNTWSFKCVCVNATKYLKERAKEKSGSESKSGMSGLIYRAKRASAYSEYCDSSASARVEIKFFHTLEQLIEMKVATDVIDPKDVKWEDIM